MIAAPSAPSVVYLTLAVDLGRCLAGSLDDMADVLAVAEGEEFGDSRRRQLGFNAEPPMTPGICPLRLMVEQPRQAFPDRAPS